MNPIENVRIDKWLWAVRLYKTRTLASEACRAGKVKIGRHSVKPSRAVRVSEIISAQTGEITRTVKVLALLDRRVGAPEVSGYLEDRTPASEYEKTREKVFHPAFHLKGRPTKKSRRAFDRFFG